MDAMDAVALGARVQQVADKLQLKAQEARAKGNGGAAQSLAESVSDLRHAAAVLLEQKRLLALQHHAAASDAPPGSSSGGDARGPRLRRNSSASSLMSMQSAFDAASVAGSVVHAPHQSELLARLLRVEKMLGKKSDEMRAKGNESAAGALQQSAAFVRAGSALIGEQQQSLQALTGSLERLQSQWRALGKLVVPSDGEAESGGDDDVLGRVAAQSAELTALRAFVTTALPDCANHRDVAELTIALQRERDAAAEAQSLSETVATLESERDQLRKQVTELKKEHAEEYLILREDIEILKSEKRFLEQNVRDVERECTERSERELSTLQAAYNVAEKANERLEAALEATEAQVSELKAQAEAWRDRFHDEQHKLSEFLSAAQKQHSTQVASLESELKAREHAIAALEKSAKTTEPEAVESSSSSVATGAPTSGNEAALIRLQDEHMELQALLTDCEKNLESELARSAQLMQEREALKTRMAEMENRHESEVEALASEHDRHATALEQKREKHESELHALSKTLARVQSECESREQIIGELKEAVDGYRDECFKVRRELEERDATIARLEESLSPTQDASVADDSQQLETEFAAFRVDTEKLQACLDSSSDASIEEIIDKLSQLELDASRGLRDAIVASMDKYAQVQHRHELLQADEQALRELSSAFLSSCESLFDEGASDSHGVTNDRFARIEASVARVLGEKASAMEQMKETLERKREAEERLERAVEEVSELQEKLTSATDAGRRLEEQLNALQAVRSQLEAELHDHKTRSVDGAGREEASARELEELRQRLKDADSEFERYRARSHAALKKVEKRAELLNGMRKENEQLKQKLEEREEACRRVEESEKRLAESLHEATQTQRMMQEELDQRAAEGAAALAASESKLLVFAAEKELACRQLQEATERLEKLEQEKAALVEARDHLNKQEAEERDAELASLKLQRQAGNDQIAALTDEIESLRTQIETRDRDMLESAANAASLQTQVRALEESIVQYERSNKDDEAANERQLRAAVDEERVKGAAKCEAMASEISRLTTEVKASAEKIRELSQSTQERSVSPAPPAVAQSAVATPDGEQEDRIARLSEQNRIYEQRIGFLEEQIDELQHRLEGHNESSAHKSEDATKDQVIRELRVQVLDLQEQLQVFEDENAARELETERGELAQIQAARVALQKQSEHVINGKQRKAVVKTFQQRLQTVVDELQRGLDDHSAAFRDACEFRDAHKLREAKSESVVVDGEPQDSESPAARSSKEVGGSSVTGETTTLAETTELFEECLVMKSGVVIKAGASFKLPVFCEKKGWRVVWTFSVKEESADVGFALLVDGTRRRQAIVAPQRVNALSGTFTVEEADEGASLAFEWDNTFSWLNEKTLDYHVSVQEPLTPAKKRIKVQTLSLQSTSKQLRDGLALLAAELASRAQLRAAVEHLLESEREKDAYTEQFAARKGAIVARKSELQQQMDELKTSLSNMLSEQDEIEDDIAALLRAWNSAVAEREDAETTMRLAEASQLEALAQQLETHVQELEQELLACQDQTTALAAA